MKKMRQLSGFLFLPFLPLCRSWHISLLLFPLLPQLLLQFRYKIEFSEILHFSKWNHQPVVCNHHRKGGKPTQMALPWTVAWNHHHTGDKPTDGLAVKKHFVCPSKELVSSGSGFKLPDSLRVTYQRNCGHRRRSNDFRIIGRVSSGLCNSYLWQFVPTPLLAATLWYF